MARVLVTGAGGFLGAHVSAALRAAGHDVTAPDRRSGLDVADAAAVERVIAGVRPAACVHLAGIARGTEAELMRTNVDGTRHVLEALARHAPGCHVVLAGSAAEYGRTSDLHAALTEDLPCDPLNAYGRSKLLATRLGEEFASGLAAVSTVRLFNVVGAGIGEQLLIGALLRRIRAALADGARAEVVVGNVDVERDYVAVADVANGIVALLEVPGARGVFNLCSGRAVTVRRVVETLLSFAPRPIAWRQDPDLVRPDDIRRSVGSFARARSAFDFEPATSLEAALRSAWSAYFGGEP